MANSNKVVTVYGYCNYIYELSGNDSEFDPDYADFSYFDSLWDNATNNGVISNRCLWVNNNLQDIYFGNFLGNIYNADWAECQKSMNFCKSGLSTNKLITYGELYDDYSIIKYPKSGSTKIYLNGRVTELSTSTVYISLTFHDKNDVWDMNAPSAAITTQGGASSATTYFSGSSSYYWAGGKINNPTHACDSVTFYARILMSDGSYVDPSASNYLNNINFGTTSNQGVALSCSTGTSSGGTYSYLNATIPITATKPIEELKYPTAIYLTGLKWKTNGSTGGDTNVITFKWGDHYLQLGTRSDNVRLKMSDNFNVYQNVVDVYAYNGTIVESGISCTITEDYSIEFDNAAFDTLSAGQYFLALHFIPQGVTNSYYEIDIIYDVYIHPGISIEFENSDLCYVYLSLGTLKSSASLSNITFKPLRRSPFNINYSSSDNLTNIPSYGSFYSSNYSNLYLSHNTQSGVAQTMKFANNEDISLLPPNLTNALNLATWCKSSKVIQVYPY